MNQACANYYGGCSGTLPVVPALKGKDHTDATIQKHLLFGIGDVSPEGSFIHVFDDLALDLLMMQLDNRFYAPPNPSRANYSLESIAFRAR